MLKLDVVFIQMRISYSTHLRFLLVNLKLRDTFFRWRNGRSCSVKRRNVRHPSQMCHCWSENVIDTIVFHQFFFSNSWVPWRPQQKGMLQPSIFSVCFFLSRCSFASTNRLDPRLPIIRRSAKVKKHPCTRHV